MRLTRSTLVWPVGLVCMAIAAILNVGLYETAVAAGVSFRIKGQADVFMTLQTLTTGFRDIEVTNVLINTVVPFLIGLTLFGLALRRSRVAAEAVLIAGVVLAVASIGVPLALEPFTPHARDLLVRMHLITGALFAVSGMITLMVGARLVPGRDHGSQAIEA